MLDKFPCTHLKGVGPKQAERLTALGIHSLQDLLFHLPRQYQDRTQITAINRLTVGNYATIEGQIQSIERQAGKHPSLLCHLRDPYGHIVLRFFHFVDPSQRHFEVGGRLRCFGEVRFGYRHLEMVHPEYIHLKEGELVAVDEHLTPIYPSTKGINQGVLRKMLDQTLGLLNKEDMFTDFLPVEFLKKYQLSPLIEALYFIHKPPPDADQQALLSGKHPMQQRLAFEELLTHHLCLQRLRDSTQQNPAFSFAVSEYYVSRLNEALPYTLTAAQQRVVKEIQADLAQDKPMLRLIQGDVGSGKTIVAAMAMLQAVENKYQAAVMAPTELLAEQHFQNFKHWLEPLGITICLLKSKLKAQEKRQTLEKIASGENQIIIGTHSLFQEGVVFKRLALIVVDEQHRFGVQQRLALKEKARQQDKHPHQLIMSATPIPRTLAMTSYADLDISVIDELPPGRTPVKTVAIAEAKRGEVIARVHQNCREGKQAYWVCPLIEESELLPFQAAEAAYEQLKTALPDIKIGLVHGRMKGAEKEETMAAFKQGMLQVLVATTVIEVGVDVPNSSLMIIENAERLGLSQLHQLRGRVGRGSNESFCVLLYKPPLNEMAKARINVLRESNDGFLIAQKDLELRGPGELLGTRQTGAFSLRIANLVRDSHLLPKAREAAIWLLEQYPELVDPLIQRWIAGKDQYGQV